MKSDPSSPRFAPEIRLPAAGEAGQAAMDRCCTALKAFAKAQGVPRLRVLPELGLPVPDTAAVRQALCELVDATDLEEGSIRLTLSRGESPRGLLPPANTRSTGPYGQSGGFCPYNGACHHQRADPAG